MIRNEDQALQRTDDPRRAEMKTPDDVSAMVRLKALGWGAKRIATELGCSKNRSSTGSVRVIGVPLKRPHDRSGSTA